MFFTYTCTPKSMMGLSIRHHYCIKQVHVYQTFLFSVELSLCHVNISALLTVEGGGHVLLIRGLRYTYGMEQIQIVEILWHTRVIRNRILKRTPKLPSPSKAAATTN
jgi:hypothetical protein